MLCIYIYIIYVTPHLQSIHPYPFAVFINSEQRLRFTADCQQLDNALIAGLGEHIYLLLEVLTVTFLPRQPRQQRLDHHQHLRRAVANIESLRDEDISEMSFP